MMFAIQYLRKLCALWHQGQLGDENFTQLPSSWNLEHKGNIGLQPPLFPDKAYPMGGVGDEWGAKMDTYLVRG